MRRARFAVNCIHRYIYSSSSAVFEMDAVYKILHTSLRDSAGTLVVFIHYLNFLSKRHNLRVPHQRQRRAHRTNASGHGKYSKRPPVRDEQDRVAFALAVSCICHRQVLCAPVEDSKYIPGTLFRRMLCVLVDFRSDANKLRLHTCCGISDFNQLNMVRHALYFGRPCVLATFFVRDHLKVHQVLAAADFKALQIRLHASVDNRLYGK